MHVQATYRLSATSRPTALTQFINNHRKKEPTINDPESFANEVYLWWISLQPPSRRIDRADSPSDGRSLICLASQVPNDETWDALRTGSSNGMFGMMCCLSWWLQMDSGRLEDDLIDLIQDVTWVLDVMALVLKEALLAAHARKADEAISPRKKGKRRAEDDLVSPRKKVSSKLSRSQPSRAQPPRSQPPRGGTSRSQPSHR